MNALIVEDQAIAALDLRTTLNDCGFRNSVIVNSGKKAIALVESSLFTFATLDIKLADSISGIEVGKILNRKNIPFVFISAFSDPQNLVRAKQLHPLGILEKPFNKETLILMLKNKFHFADISN